MLGERLRAARIGKGLSLRSVAQMVGVSHQAIWKYERNEDVPSSGVLVGIADALGVAPEYFFRRSRPINVVPVFPKRKGLTIRGQRMISSVLSEALERRLELEQLASVTVENELPTLALELLHPDPLMEAEKAAHALRRAWRLGTGPIANLIETLEDKGIRIEMVDGIDTPFDACGVWAETYDGWNESPSHDSPKTTAIPAIALRRGLPLDTQRLGLAREVGYLTQEHAFAHSPDNSLTEKQREQAAIRFARAILVHSSAARQELGDHRNGLSLDELTVLNRKYGVSVQAWIYRVSELGIISDSAKTRLSTGMSRQVWCVKEQSDRSPETPTKAMQIALRAVAEGAISRAKAAELLRVPLLGQQDQVDDADGP